MIATNSDPSEMDPKEYVRDRFKAPRVTALGCSMGLKKYQDPKTPEMVVCVTFLRTSEIHWVKIWLAADNLKEGNSR